jgi:hypothetical protein
MIYLAVAGCAPNSSKSPDTGIKTDFSGKSIARANEIAAFNPSYFNYL